MNNLQILGRLTRDPELRYGQNGKALCQFSIAVNRNKDEADFFDCTAFEKTAETISNYVKKGQRILIDGRLQQDRWKDQQTGEDRSKVKILVNRFDFIESAEQGGTNQQAPSPTQRTNNAPPQPPMGGMPGPYGQPPAPYPGQYGQAPQPPQAPPGYPIPPQQQQQQQGFWMGGNAPQQQQPAPNPYGYPASLADHKDNPFNPNNPPF
jgi:single-strand DNA-binding protein